MSLLFLLSSQPLEWVWWGFNHQCSKEERALENPSQEAVWPCESVGKDREKAGLCPTTPVTSSKAWGCRCSRDSPSSRQALKFLLRVSISALMPWWYFMSSSTEETSLGSRGFGEEGDAW